MPTSSSHRLLGLRPSVVVGMIQFWTGVMCLVWAVWPPITYQRVDGVSGVALLVLAAVSFTTLDLARTPAAVLDILLLLTVAVLMVLVATRPSPLGQIAFGIVLVPIGVAAALYLPPWRLAGHLAVYAAGFLIAATVNPMLLSAILAVQVIGTMVLVSVVVSRLTVNQATLTTALADQATRDPLTGALNRRGAQVAARELRAVVDRLGAPTTVIMIDLNDFKGYNERHGHPAGDTLLRTLVQCWRGVLRTGDLLARMGGDEFLVLLPNTDIFSAGALISRMHACHPAAWTHGMAEWQPGESFDSLLQRADRALYRNKDRVGRQPGRASSGS